MRKWIALIVLIIAVTLLGLPYVMGIKAQQKHDEFIARINETFSPYLVFKVQNYQRGWFSSDAEISGRFFTPKRTVDQGGQQVVQPERVFDFMVPKETIKHGPIIIDEDKFGLGIAFIKLQQTIDGKLSKDFSNLFSEVDQLPTFTHSEFFDLFGRVEGSTSVTGFTAKSKESDAVLSWQGFTQTHSTDANVDRIFFNMDVEPASIKGPMGSFQFDQLSMQGHYYKKLGSLWVGDFAMHWKGMSLAQANNNIDVKDFGFSVTANVENGKANQSLLVSLNGINLNNVSYGPGELMLGINNVNAQALIDINKVAEKLRDPNLSDNEKQQLMFSILGQLPALLKDGIVISLQKMTFKMPNGTVTGDAKVNLPKEFNMANPIAALQSMNAYANLVIPKALLQQGLIYYSAQKISQEQALQTVLAKQLEAAQSGEKNDQNASVKPMSAAEIAQVSQKWADNMTQQWLKNGYLIEQGNDFKFNFQLSNGVISINNKQFLQ